MTDDIPVHCGWCGEELDSLGADHWCDRAQNVMEAVATGDISRLEVDG